MTIATLVFLVFLVLKLTGVVVWSWLWVTSPLWIWAALIGLVFALIGAVAVVAVKMEGK